MPQIFSDSVGLNSDEQRRRQIITQELQGNAKPRRHEADADHLYPWRSNVTGVLRAHLLVFRNIDKD